MKTKIIILVCISFLIMHHSSAQMKDLRADVNQSSFDKILNSTKFPLTLFEHSDPFKSLDDRVLLNDETTVYFDEKKSIEIVKDAFYGAKALEPFEAKDVNSVYRDAIKNEWYRINTEIEKLIEEQEKQNSKGGDPKIPKTQLADFTIDELKEIQTLAPEEGFAKLYAKDRGGFIKAHLAYARVEIASKPSLSVKSPNFSLQNLSVRTTATGELWMKVPVFKCCRTVLGICVCFRIEWKWNKIASLTVSPKFGADVTIRFSESQLKIYAQGQFDKLFLDYFILREIDLKGLANSYLKNEKFEIYDAVKFVASLPYINTNFRIESLNLPPRVDGLSIEINIK
jgi:hypothetical protein